MRASVLYAASGRPHPRRTAGQDREPIRPCAGPAALVVGGGVVSGGYRRGVQRGNPFGLRDFEKVPSKLSTSAKSMSVVSGLPVVFASIGCLLYPLDTDVVLSLYSLYQAEDTSPIHHTLYEFHLHYMSHPHYTEGVYKRNYLCLMSSE